VALMLVLAEGRPKWHASLPQRWQNLAEHWSGSLTSYQAGQHRAAWGWEPGRAQPYVYALVGCLS